jgi:lambda family phage tail tape measure protein
MTLNRDAAFRLKVNVDGANQISAFSRNLKGLETTAKLNKAQLGQMNIQINRMAREAGNTTAGIRQHIAALTTLRDRVDLNSNAYKRLGREIDQLQVKLRQTSKEADASGGAGGGLFGRISAMRGRIAAFTAAAAGVGILTKSITDAGVSFTESERRLRSLSLGFDSFTQVQFAATAAAQKFGLSQTEANQQFAQIYARLRPIGLSLSEIRSVFNGFNTAAKLSGTTAQEASAAFLQLSQGLGTGVLRGEELNSVFEQTPAVVQAIAKEMGVGVGQIRDLAKEGKITSDIVIAALKSIERDGSDRLEEALKGPEQQFKNLQNAVEDLKIAAADVALPAIIEGVRMLTSTVKFLSDIVSNTDWNTVFALIGQSAGGVPAIGQGPRGQQKSLVRPMGPELTPEIIAGVRAREEAARPRPRPAGGGGDAQKIKDITQFQLDAGKRLLAAKQTQNELLIAETQYEVRLAALDAQKMGVRDRELAEAELANNLLLTQLDYAEQVGRAVAQDFLKRQELQDSYNRTVEELKLKAGIITGEEAKQLEIKHQVEAILQRLPGLTDEQIAKIKELVTATQEQGKSFKESFQDKIDEYKESLADFGGQAADAVINAFKGMEDALTDFVMTGKANFADLARSIIADITRIAIRQAIIKPLVGALFPTPNAMGNVFAQNGIVPFAKGGIVDRPMVFPFAKGIGLMGEAGPEAIMPLKRGPGGRLGVEASGGGSVQVGSINISVQNTGEQLSAAAQKQIATQVQGIVMATLVNEQRSGGVLR